MKILRKEKRNFAFILFDLVLETGKLLSLLMPIFFDLYKQFVYYPCKVLFLLYGLQNELKETFFARKNIYRHARRNPFRPCCGKGRSWR